MQKPAKPFVLALLVIALAPCAALAQSGNDSVLTVDELLRIENAQVREGAKRAAIAAGLAMPAKPAASPLSSAAPKGPRPPTVLVHSIKGVGQAYRVDLTYNGELHKDVTPKARVKGRFVLEGVQGACVALTSLEKAFESSVACWSGLDPEPSDSALTLTSPSPGTPLPPSLVPRGPIPTIPVGMPLPTPAPGR